MPSRPWDARPSLLATVPGVTFSLAPNNKSLTVAPLPTALTACHRRNGVKTALLRGTNYFVFFFFPFPISNKTCPPRDTGQRAEWQVPVRTWGKSRGLDILMIPPPPPSLLPSPSLSLLLSSQPPSLGEKAADTRGHRETQQACVSTAPWPVWLQSSENVL